MEVDTVQLYQNALETLFELNAASLCSYNGAEVSQLVTACIETLQNVPQTVRLYVVFTAIYCGPSSLLLMPSNDDFSFWLFCCIKKMYILNELYAYFHLTKCKQYNW